MRTPEDIAKAQATYNDILIKTELSSLPDGYIGGGTIELNGTDVFIAPFVANVGGKRVVKSVSTNIMDMDWEVLKTNSTYFHIYLNRYGFWSVNTNEPVTVDGKYGLYQKESNERYMGTVYVDSSGEFSKVISWKKIRAEDLDAGSITADEIKAGTISADKLITGIKGTAYSQPLAPNLVFLGDTWLDTDTGMYHRPIIGDIDTSKGGADSSVIIFDNIYGGADSSVTSFDNTYGNMNSLYGWMLGGLAAGSTKIDGGQIETDSLKSANFETGVSGSKFDLANGYIETGSGVFRGDMKIGSDDADRQLDLGSKGLLVKDKNGVIIHNLPNAPIAIGHHYLGHLLFSDGVTSGYTIYNSTSAPASTWTTVTCSDLGTSNAKGGIFKVFKSGIGSATVNPYSYVFLRPYGSSWSSAAGGLSPEMRWFMNFSTGDANQMSFATQMICPFDSSFKMQFYAKTVPNSTLSQLTIVQIGVFV